MARRVQTDGCVGAQRTSYVAVRPEEDLRVQAQAQAQHPQDPQGQLLAPQEEGGLGVPELRRWPLLEGGAGGEDTLFNVLLHNNTLANVLLHNNTMCYYTIVHWPMCYYTIMYHVEAKLRPRGKMLTMSL